MAVPRASGGLHKVIQSSLVLARGEGLGVGKRQSSESPVDQSQLARGSLPTRKGSGGKCYWEGSQGSVLGGGTRGLPDVVPRWGHQSLLSLWPTWTFLGGQPQYGFVRKTVLIWKRFTWPGCWDISMTSQAPQMCLTVPLDYLEVEFSFSRCIGATIKHSAELWAP